MTQITPQTKYPAFIVERGEVLVLKMYDYVIEDGKLVVRDLPLPGEKPVYMNEEEQKIWHETNQAFLNARAK